MASEHDFPQLCVVHHPVVADNLTAMRDKNCPFPEFRARLKTISLLLAFVATENMGTTTRRIETPLTWTDAPCLDEKGPVIVPILRAGLGLVDGLLTVCPDAILGHIGLYRDEETHTPHEYLVRLPNPIPTDRRFIVVDPMLATGHSAVHAVDVLVGRGVPAGNIALMTLVCAPEGVTTFQTKYPFIPIITAALDSHLNEKAYIVPGLGDAGDRIFGTL